MNNLSQQNRNLLVGFKTKPRGKYSGIAPSVAGLSLGQPLSIVQEGAVDAFLAEKTKACTKDARVCPDGSTVGRVPPNCEFEPCPEVRKNYMGLWIILALAALFAYLTIGKKKILKP